LGGLLPQANILGIDLNREFVALANDHRQRGSNVHFQRKYLRGLLNRQQRYDVVLFCSVLHEFWTYGEGISSVLKALADAHELLHAGGTTIIRDMILNDYMWKATLNVASMRARVLASPHADTLREFEAYWGQVDHLASINH